MLVTIVNAVVIILGSLLGITLKKESRKVIKKPYYRVLDWWFY